MQAPSGVVFLMIITTCRAFCFIIHILDLRSSQIALISPVRYNNTNNAIFLLHYETGVAIMTKDSILSRIWLLVATNLYLMKDKCRKQKSRANEKKTIDENDR